MAEGYAPTKGDTLIELGDVDAHGEEPSTVGVR